MVVFATPGMLHAGLSLQVFKKWAPNPNNMVRSVDIKGSLIYYNTNIAPEFIGGWGGFEENFTSPAQLCTL